MPPAAVVIGSNVVVDNLQHTQRIAGTLTITPGTGYQVGGIPLDQAILSIPGVQTNSGIRTARFNSLTGSGYIYERIAGATVGAGKLMVLQVPPAGSLTTAGPLQQLSSAANSLSAVAADTIAFECFCLRNA